MTVLDIIKAWLTEHGYDGLYNDDGCFGCKLHDLVSCEEGATDCRAGVVVYQEDGDWHIGPRAGEAK